MHRNVVFKRKLNKECLLRKWSTDYGVYQWCIRKQWWYNLSNQELSTDVQLVPIVICRSKIIDREKVKQDTTFLNEYWRKLQDNKRLYLMHEWISNSELRSIYYHLLIRPLSRRLGSRVTLLSQKLPIQEELTSNHVS